MFLGSSLPIKIPSIMAQYINISWHISQALFWQGSKLFLNSISREKQKCSCGQIFAHIHNKIIRLKLIDKELLV